MQDVPAGGTVSFDFPAEIEGIFEAELEGRKEQIAEIRVNPREGDGSSVVDRVEFYKEDGIAAPRLVGVGTLVDGSDPAQYQLSYAANDHGTPGMVLTYFANCVARSLQDSTKVVPAYSRPVRVRRGS